MKRYIYHERNGIYIIDLHQTLRLLEEAYDFIRQVVAEGNQVIFVGTKRQAQESVQQHAERCGMPYVTHRWLGGMLTNYQTLRKRVEYLEQLEQEEASGEWTRLTKKEGLGLKREMEKLQQNLGGYRTLEGLPGAVYTVDLKREHIAAAEARKLGIPLVSIVDSNCNPELADFPIPGNDDAIRALRLITSKMADAVVEGQQEREARLAEEAALAVAQAEEEAAEEADIEEEIWTGAVEDQFIENAFEDIQDEDEGEREPQPAEQSQDQSNDDYDDEQ